MDLHLQQDGLESFTLIMPEAPGPAQDSEFEAMETLDIHTPAPTTLQEADDKWTGVLENVCKQFAELKEDLNSIRSDGVPLRPVVEEEQAAWGAGLAPGDPVAPAVQVPAELMVKLRQTAASMENFLWVLADMKYKDTIKADEQQRVRQELIKARAKAEAERDETVQRLEKLEDDVLKLKARGSAAGASSSAPPESHEIASLLKKLTKMEHRVLGAERLQIRERSENDRRCGEIKQQYELLNQRFQDLEGQVGRPVPAATTSTPEPSAAPPVDAVAPTMQQDQAQAVEGQSSAAAVLPASTSSQPRSKERTKHLVMLPNSDVDTEKRKAASASGAAALAKKTTPKKTRKKGR